MCRMPPMRVLALILVFSVSSLAQSIRLRLVNDKDGQPLSKISVYAQFSPPSTSAVMPKLHSETDASGQAEFTVPQPTPERLWVSVGLNSPPWVCDCTFVMETASVLQSGAVRQVPRSKASVAAMNLEPGRVIIHARPVTLIEKLLWTIFRGEL